MKKRTPKMGRTITNVCTYIEQAKDAEIHEIIAAVERRYATLYPDWDVVYMAVHKEPQQREADLQGIIALLQKEKADSLG